jgi:hypothetical protein
LSTPVARERTAWGALIDQHTSAWAEDALQALAGYDESFAIDPAEPLALMGIFSETAAAVVAELKKTGLKQRK